MDISNIWNLFLEKVKDMLDPILYETWLMDTELIDLNENSAKLWSEFIELEDKFINSANNSQTKNMAQILGNPNEYAKYITTDEETTNNDLKSYLKELQNDGYAGKLDIERHELLPEFLSRYIDFKLEINDFIHYNFGSLAISLYLILISLFITINKKGNILIYIIPLSIFITLLIATPVACEFRYVYSLYLTAPLFLIMSLKRGVVNEK